ncbi:UDP-N-acetylmuramate--L-alanine ligase [Zunongwangia profunda]|uniref:UDP-N-acetylmuramate:L-alanyl-gamma-D-glutamyl-meso-diaminopimelate ligase n=2 Tax=Zunongwangia profunda TaxID=398743 RepID=D5BM59_ZUNPS|nr:Mur ligase family protein [Zunongwangia profunda]ADF54199.1 UDP-N-acetylmuramate:L-alanyl-gamma-D-glutamyl-meso-diaminopimelate ligase [Zunongwangia profunda SM-A87]HAJ80997.1 peptidoglycan synthetase [Zunongwangia profunda]HCV81778.1 peptidoglycan synthetase [Zunongwangia profunda]
MNIHFIAIGGSAMHALAIALHKKGFKVAGSDDAIFEPSKSALEKSGILPSNPGWFPEKITRDLDAVILGMHAKKDNPELLKAQELGIKIYSYPEFIFEQCKTKTRVVVGGSHGKTTITSMILHVMHYHDRQVDYMVGAQLEGLENTIQLNDDNDFIVIEGDEYLSSAIDLRPKFHLYEPNIALLSGIAWDHINVFPTYEDYIEQFRIFVSKIVNGGILVYNEEEPELKKIVENSTNPIRKHPYHTPEYYIEDGETILVTPEGDMPLEIFGKHNLSNLAGAKWVCQHMGVDEEDFYEAIASFKGASKRLQKIKESGDFIVFKDFAHSPSKVNASLKAVKEQFQGKKIIACLELHTFSSLNQDFITEYKNSLDAADEAIVFYSLEAVTHKNLKPISSAIITSVFGRDDLRIITETADLENYLKTSNFDNSVLLFMSSGNYGGIDLERLVNEL